MRIQLSIDGATTEQVRDLTVAWGRTLRTTGYPLPASNLPAPTVGIDGTSMRWTSPHLNQQQAHLFFEALATVQEPRLEAKVNERDNLCGLHLGDQVCTAPANHYGQHTWSAHFNA